MLDINPFIVLAQLINFGILYGIFKYFIADTLNARIEARKKQLEKLDTAEAHYEEKIKMAKAQKEEMIIEARKIGENLRKESEKIAKEKAQAIIQKANSDTKAILEGGRRELEKERLSMLSEMKKHIMDVSLKLNQKMFGDEKMSKEFVEKELREID